MNKVLWIKIVAASGLLSVVIGAFAAHVLDAVVTADRMDTLDTAVQYQIFHTLALLGLIGIDDQLKATRCTNYVAGFFLLGMVLFCGSLYMLVATNISQFAIITPLGGLSFMMGWIMLLIAAIREK
jgi:uncharacterized membrane protein YgdD (TMEM256/DUF423 family)